LRHTTGNPIEQYQFARVIFPDLGVVWSNTIQVNPEVAVICPADQGRCAQVE
jgi:hypothetical protein